MISPAPPRFAFRLRRFGGTKGGKARPFRANLFPVRPQRPSGCRHPRNPHNLKFLNGRSGKTPHFSAFSQHSPKQRAGFLRSFSFIRLRKFSDHPAIHASTAGGSESTRLHGVRRPNRARQALPNLAVTRRHSRPRPGPKALKSSLPAFHPPLRPLLRPQSSRSP